MSAKWVPTALRLAFVESRYNCAARGPRLRQGDRALGLGQVRLGSARALGYSGSAQAMLECSTGVQVMLMHMKKCESMGATTEALMARCHVAGWGSLGKRLRGRAESYARQYQQMVRVGVQVAMK